MTDTQDTALAPCPDIVERLRAELADLADKVACAGRAGYFEHWKPSYHRAMKLVKEAERLRRPSPQKESAEPARLVPRPDETPNEFAERVEQSRPRAPQLIDLEALATARREALPMLERCRTILDNMAKENKPEIAFRWQRWPINHEPLRADAKNLLPELEAAIRSLSSPDKEK